MKSIDGASPQTSHESHFAAMLSAYHECLLAETDVTAHDATDPPLASAAACVELLEQLRRDRSAVPESDPERDTTIRRESDESAAGDNPPGPPLGRLGRFEVRRELGRGGHGIVFLAFDPALDREVALKIARPEVLADDDLRQRFLREGKAAAILDHPNLVPVYEAGQAGPICYIASAYAPGVTLAECLARRTKAVPARTAAALAECLAEAVEYMHNRNVLHRDLKPANVLLDVQPEADDCAVGEAWARRARLTDFGLAKSLDACADQAQSALLAGTPAYIAPETVGGGREIGRRTDVYGLGVILYETLTGLPPVQGDSLLDTLHRVLTVEPPAPCRVQSRWTPDVPRDLETICLKAIAREPQARYATAGELAADLRRFLDGLPVRARPVGPIGSMWRWCRRRPLVAALVSAVVVSVMVGFVATFSEWRRAERHHLEARDNLRETRAAVDRYFTRISENVLLDEPELQSLRRELLNDAVDYYRGFVARHGEDPELREELAAAYFRLGSITWEIGSAEEAQEAHESGLALRRELLAEHPDDPVLRRGLAESCYDLGILAWEGADPGRSLELHQEGCRIRVQLVAENPDDLDLQHDLGWSFNNIGQAAAELNRVEEALHAFGAARDIFERLTAAQPADAGFRGDLAVTLNRYGLLDKSIGRHAQAFELHRRALTELTTPTESDSLRREMAATHRYIGDVLRRLDVHDPESARSYEQAVEVSRQLVHDHPAVLRYQGELGEALFWLGSARQSLGELERALEAFEETCEIRERIVETTPGVAVHEYRLAMAHHHAGDTLRLLNRLTEAIPHYLRACEVCETLVERQPEQDDYRMELGSSSFGLGTAQQSAGDGAQARAAFARAAEVFQSLLNRTGDETAYRKWHTASQQALAQLHPGNEAGS